MPSHLARGRHRVLAAFLWVVLAACAATMALRCLPVGMGDGHDVPIIVPFLPYLGIPLIVALVAGLLCRRRALPVAAAALLAVLAWWHAGYLVPASTVSDEAAAAVEAGVDTSDGVARIMTLNLTYGGADPDEVVACVRDEHVEVLCLQEATNDYLAELDAAGIGDYLPNRVVSEVGYVNNGGRNCVYAAMPTRDESSDLLPIITSSMAACSVDVGGRTLRFVSVHANSPHLGGQDWWASGLETIGELAGYDHDYVICGDFNATWDHTRFRALLGDAFVDAGETAGEGFHMTYPANSALPPLIEIDHVVYSRDAGIVVGDLETVEVSGTDHLALLATLEVVG